MDVRQFVLGKDEYPDWFKQLAADNKVYFKTSDTGELERVTIKTLTGPKEAVVGDYIMYMGDESENSHPIQVIPAKIASKYMR